MSRPVVLLLATMAALLVLVSGVALAATVKCTAGSFCKGTPGDDEMEGSAGSEEMRGLGGSDILRGMSGFDLLRGGPGKDRLKGGSDGDTYLFENGWGADTVVDGSGYDSLDFSFVTTPVKIDLTPRASGPEARSGRNTVNLLRKSTVIEQAQGGFAGDSIWGNNADNALEGDEGNDYISGRDGDDGIGGGNGNDTLVGGLGRDVITARNGNDTIRAADGESDEISCGDGADTVYFDPDLDTVAGNCENLKPQQ